MTLEGSSSESSLPLEAAFNAEVIVIPTKELTVLGLQCAFVASVHF